MQRKAFTLAALLTLSAWASADRVPILIVQVSTSGKSGGEMDVSMANYIATQLDATGKVKSIVYSLTDPVFRSAVESGVLQQYPDWPSFSLAVRIAHTLKADYVLTYSAAAVKTRTSRARADLFLNGRRVWKEESNFGVQKGNGIDDRDTSESLASTWASHISAGPLKGVQPDAKVPTPAPLVGQVPTTPPAQPGQPVPAAKDNSDLKKELQKRLDAHDTSHAIELLRDAIDSKPQDVERRFLLVKTLLDAGYPADAGQEADRALKLFPDDADLRSLAAKAWMAAGREDAAQADLNEAIVHKQGGGAAMVMLGELALKNGDPARALDSLDTAIKNDPSVEAYYLRAMCRALVGGSDGVNLDLKAMRAQGPPMSDQALNPLYVIGANLLDKSLKSTGDAVRQLMQQARVKPTDTELHDQVSQMLRVLDAQSAFMSGASAPPKYQASHDRRLLAIKLMIESLVGVQSFFDSGSQDVMTDAVISLGDAIRQANLAHAAYLDAQKQTTG